MHGMGLPSLSASHIVTKPPEAHPGPDLHIVAAKAADEKYGCKRSSPERSQKVAEQAMEKRC
jgi:hypothetical protein